METKAPARTGSEKPRKRTRKSWAELQSPVWYRSMVFLVHLLLRYWVRCYRSFGAEKVPASGGVFVICNHTTGMDPFLLGYPIWRRHPHGPGKIEIFVNPVFGHIMRKIGIFPLRQNTADVAAVRAMIELYRAGEVVLVYPEGGRSPTGEMRPFMPDFARLMLRLKATLVPAAIAGGKDLLPIGRFIPRRKTAVAVVYGDPFDLSEYDGRQITPELAEEVAQSMQQRVADLLATAREERAKLAERC